MITYKINGTWLTVSEIANLKGFLIATTYNVLRRIERLYPNATEEEFSQLVLDYKLREGRGLKYYATKTAEEWAEILGVCATTYRWRVRQYGVSDKRTYESKKEAQARRIEKHKKNLSKWAKIGVQKRANEVLNRKKKAEALLSKIPGPTSMEQSLFG